MTSYEDKKLIEEKREELEVKYSMAANYSSRCTLWTEGWRDGLVDKDLYDKARAYYGRSWAYTGDR